jgi:hypothetical protein
MSKLLNRLKKTLLIGAPPVDSSTYQPSVPRVALAITGVAMTMITIAVSVILPAQMDSGSREARMLASSKATPPAAMGLVTVTRIDVVATREPGSSTVPVRIGQAAPQPRQLGTTSPAVVRVSSTDQ